MKTADDSFAQCFNAQAVVDADHQVIIATDVNNCAADSQTFSPMMEQARRNTGRAPAAGSGRRRLLLGSEPRRCSEAHRPAQHRAPDRSWSARSRRDHRACAARPDPEDPDSQAADGPPAPHKNRQGRLRPTQGHDHHHVALEGGAQCPKVMSASLGVLRRGLSDVDDAVQPGEGHRGEHPRTAVDDGQVATVVPDVSVR